MIKRGLISLLSIAVLFAFIATAASAVPLTPVQKLGQKLYFDEDLSINQNQSCATCHHPSAAFADPLNRKLPYDFPVSLGSDTSLNGGRNAPTSSYAAFSPNFSYDVIDGENFPEGGQFWDGRADTLADQAEGPFLNPVEMGMLNEAAVIAAIAEPKNNDYKNYKRLFMSVWGIDIDNVLDVVAAYEAMAVSIGEFEKTERFNQFSSKFDYVMAGLATFTPAEQRGFEMFNRDPADIVNTGLPSAGCFLCHPAPLFTDFSYDNLGIPKSTNPLIDPNPIDLGLGAGDNPIVDPAAEVGKFKVSTLRNIARTAPYGHNGFFATLQEIVFFYNTAADTTIWDPTLGLGPEVSDNVNRAELGSLGLTPQDEMDLVTFLKTLTDGFRNGAPRGFAPPPMPNPPIVIP
jgi:cytochrome c peroxidase